MKFFKSSAVALAVLILVVAAGSVYGLSRKPLEVQYHQWIADDAGVLTESTVEMLHSYNQQWDSRYNAAIAVAAVDSTHGWSGAKYAAMLGKQWGLGQNDMLRKQHHHRHPGVYAAQGSGQRLLRRRLRPGGAEVLPGGGCGVRPAGTAVRT